MKRLNDSDILCRKLFDVRMGSQKQEYIAVSAGGDLLYVTEELYGMMMTGCLKMVFLLDKAEFREHVERAKRRGKLQKAIANSWTTMAEIEHLCGD